MVASRLFPAGRSLPCTLYTASSTCRLEGRLRALSNRPRVLRSSSINLRKNSTLMPMMVIAQHLLSQIRYIAGFIAIKPGADLAFGFLRRRGC